jgi:hypothetical protein
VRGTHVRFEGDEAGAWGHFNVNIVVLGDQGRVGKLLMRERTSRDGTTTEVLGGGCSF